MWNLGIIWVFYMNFVTLLVLQTYSLAKSSLGFITFITLLNVLTDNSQRVNSLYQKLTLLIPGYLWFREHSSPNRQQAVLIKKGHKSHSGLVSYKTANSSGSFVESPFRNFSRLLIKVSCLCLLSSSIFFNRSVSFSRFCFSISHSYNKNR